MPLRLPDTSACAPVRSVAVLSRILLANRRVPTTRATLQPEAFPMGSPNMANCDQ